MTASISTPPQIKKSLAEILAEKRKAAAKAEAISAGTHIEWNTEQQDAINLGRAIPMQSFCLTGAAGTGKSTVTAEILKPLIQSSKLTQSTKYLSAGSPGVAIVCFTRRAANNIRRMVAPELKGNVLTVHKLLEFTRDFEQVFDPASGTIKTKVVFYPKRNGVNPLPLSLRQIVVDESSTLGTNLYGMLAEAAPHAKFIFIGDINQLPPVGDDSIFGYKLEELPTVELKHVYRQALESKPLALAHRVLSGNPIYTAELKKDWSDHPDLLIRTFDSSLKGDEKKALLVAASVLEKRFRDGQYDPENDIVLCPFNKRFGTLELNKWILDFAYPDRAVHEIIAGFETHYLAVGDSVLFQKDDFVITKINRNASYKGREPSGIPCDRWGRAKAGMTFDNSDANESNPFGGGEEFEFDIEALASGEDTERVNQASHVIHLASVDNPGLADVIISSAGDVNSISFGHATTIHKAQGSGWDRVFIFIHNSHSVALSRELLYTGLTRVKKRLEIFCEPDTFVKGIKNARIPGTTAKEKAKFFKGKAEAKAAMAEAGKESSEAEE